MQTLNVLPITEAPSVDPGSKGEAVPQDTVPFDVVLDQERRTVNESRKREEELQAAEQAALLVPAPQPEPRAVAPVCASAEEVVFSVIEEVASDAGGTPASDFLTLEWDGADVPRTREASTSQPEAGPVHWADVEAFVATTSEPSIEVDGVGRVQANLQWQAPAVEQGKASAPPAAGEPVLNVDAPEVVEVNVLPARNEIQPQEALSLPEHESTVAVESAQLEIPRVEEIQTEASDSEEQPLDEPDFYFRANGPSPRTDIHPLEPARLAEAQKPHILRQLTSAVKVLEESGQTSLKIQLQPESLGRIELQLISDQDGVRVSMIAESQPTSSLLQENMADLQRSLEDAGVELLDLSVGQHKQQHETPEEKTHQSWQPVSAKSPGEVHNVPLSIFSDPDALVDYRI
ncbi:MAG: flagellar hook-length control protein FliK [Anaerolineales bacterium]|nr:flagellar hook-length control protein FliK [Anaerolineales bacterium]